MSLDYVIGYNHGRNIEEGFVRSLTAICLSEHRPANVIASQSSSFLVDGRNALVHTFMGTDHEYLLLCDDDMVLPVDVAPRLLRYAGPDQAVGALCFTATAEPAMFSFDGERITEWDDGALVPVLATGGACVMLHRSMFERAPYPWFFIDSLKSPCDQDQNMFLWLGQHGTKVAVDTSVVAGHIKSHVIDSPVRPSQVQSGS